MVKPPIKRRIIWLFVEAGKQKLKQSVKLSYLKGGKTMKQHYHSSALALLCVVSIVFTSKAQLGSYESHDSEQEVYHEMYIDGKLTVKNQKGQIKDFRDINTTGIQRMIEMGYGSAVETKNTAKSDAGPKFNIVYRDVIKSTGKGFAHPEKGALRRQTLEAAFEYVSTMITNTGSADIVIEESNSTIPSEASNVFAKAGAFTIVADGFAQNNVIKHIITGVDPSPNPDGSMEFNFGGSVNPFYFYDYPADPSGGQYDFFTICLHEICHLLGIASSISCNGTATTFSSFDQFLRTQDGQPIVVGNAVNPPSVLASNNVVFELGNGNAAPIFSPNPCGGSSLSHFDNSRSSGQPYLMAASLSRGATVRHLSHEEAYVLQQLGYTLDLGVATSVNDEFAAQFEDSPVVGDLYPNPSSKDKAVKINMANVREREILVIVYDILGRQAYSKVLINDGGEGGTYTAIDPSHNLAAGMYIVVGSTKDELFNKKLIIR